MVHYVVKHIHVGIPRACILHAPPLFDRALVGQPHNGVDVAGIAYVDRILVESRRNDVSIVRVRDACVGVLLLVDVRSHHRERWSLVVV